MSKLDKKINSVFCGKVVRKDLVRKVKVGANVPVYVLEYLLGKYCASNSYRTIRTGLKIVNDILADKYVSPDESMKAQAKIKTEGKHTFIDKVSVRLVASEDKYWATLVNFSYTNVHIPDKFIKKYGRLLQGGIWAQVEMEYLYESEGAAKKSPFRIKDLKPIQIAAFDMDEYTEKRKRFSTDEWIDFLIRSIGLEPTKFDKRKKLLQLSRFIPLVENNFNFIELGPRGTGKSYAFQDISPYSILLTGPTTVANLFYNISKKEMGLVGLWDAVAFDEVTDLKQMPAEVISSLKTYCESGFFARGKESLSGKASIVFFGNTNQPIDVLVQGSHLFALLPSNIKDDMAFLDRIFFFLPGWELEKMRNEFLTNNYGFVVDYFAEALRELRKRNFTECMDRYYNLGSHFNTRDTKAVRKTLSGFLKLIHPDEKHTKSELLEYLKLAVEGRRRVKEQLKKLAPYEYPKTSFSIIDKESLKQTFVKVPEELGKGVISSDPLAPGTVYTVVVAEQTKSSIYRIEVHMLQGTGRLKLSGAIGRDMKDSFKRAFDYLSSVSDKISIGKALNKHDFNVEAIDLLRTGVDASCGIALFVALISALTERSIMPAAAILGDMTVQGNLKNVPLLSETLHVALDNGAKKALIPIEHKEHLDVSADIVSVLDPVFYNDPLIAVAKGLEIV